MGIKKKYSLLFFLSYFFSLSISFCQIHKGKILFGGTVNPFNNNKFKLEADMRVGYLLKENIVLGLNAGTYMWNYKSGDPLQIPYLNSRIKGELASGSFGVFSRYYFFVKKINFFSEAGAGYSILKWKYEGQYALSGNVNHLYIKSGLGLNYLLVKNVYMEVLGSYRWNNVDPIPFNYCYKKNMISANLGVIVLLP